MIINKVDTATAEQVAAVRETIAKVNPNAIVIEAESPVTVDDPEAIAGKSVIVVEDGPTLTHGEMGFGAGTIAAEQHGATPVDPRPYATGSLKECSSGTPTWALSCRRWAMAVSR